MKRNFIFLFILFFGISESFAKPGKEEINADDPSSELIDLVSDSPMIYEGKIIRQRSFIEETSGNILTSSTLEVYKVFKGAKSQFVEIITAGGVVGDKMQISSHSPRLNVNMVGLFFLKENENNNFSIVHGDEGFFVYNLNRLSAYSHDYVFENYPASLYSVLEKYTSAPSIIKETNNGRALSFSNTSTINDFSPDTIAAGAGAVLTITGSGFGTTRGKGYVDFGQAKGDSVRGYVLWSDTEIKVIVPQNAFTDKIAVVNNLGSYAITSDSLQIPYSIINLDLAGLYSDSASFIPKLKNTNGAGGMDFKIAASLYNQAPGAFNRFRDAVESWRCDAAINFDIKGFSVETKAKQDGVNLICINPTLLNDHHARGNMTAYYSLCTDPLTNEKIWYIDEIDIEFAGDKNFFYDYSKNPSLLPVGTANFMNIALHELGHGANQLHVRSKQNFMYPQTNPGVSPTASFTNTFLKANKDAAAFMLNLSKDANVTCGVTPFLAVESAQCQLGKKNGATQVVSRIDTHTNNICVGQSVTFQSTSTGTIDQVFWLFGNHASIPEAVGPGPHTVTYNETGEHQILLMVKGAGGMDITYSYVTVSAFEVDTLFGPDAVCPNTSNVYFSLHKNGIKLNAFTTQNQTTAITIPPTPPAANDYIELKNYSPASVNISGWKIYGSFRGTVSSLSFVSQTLSPGQILVAPSQGGLMTELNKIDLDDSNGYLVLLDGANKVIDYIAYGNPTVDASMQSYEDEAVKQGIWIKDQRIRYGSTWEYDGLGNGLGDWNSYTGLESRAAENTKRETITWSIQSGTINNNYGLAGIITSWTTNSGKVMVSSTNHLGCASPVFEKSLSIFAGGPPVLSINIVKPTSCKGESLKFTSQVQGGGTSPTYQWKVNGTNATTTNEYSTIALKPGDAVSLIVTSSLSCASPKTATQTIYPVIHPPDTVKLFWNMNETEVCKGSVIKLNVRSEHLPASSNYNWCYHPIGNSSPTQCYTTTTSYYNAHSNDISGNEWYVYSGEFLRPEQCLIYYNAKDNTTGLINTYSAQRSFSVVDTIRAQVNILSSQASYCQGELISLGSSVLNEGNNPFYEWKVNGLTVGNNAPDFSSSNLVNGDVVELSLTSSAKCMTNNPSDELEINSTVCDGIQNASNELFMEVFPNPATDFIYLKNISADKINKLEIFDLSGKKWIQSENENMVEVNSLVKGMYVLHLVTSDNKNYVVKFSKL